MKRATLRAFKCRQGVHRLHAGYPNLGLVEQPFCIDCKRTAREIRNLEAASAATSVEAAITHHRKHGDMAGLTCLLNRCALHYPEPLHRRRSVVRSVKA